LVAALQDTCCDDYITYEKKSKDTSNNFNNIS